MNPVLFFRSQRDTSRLIKKCHYLFNYHVTALILSTQLRAHETVGIGHLCLNVFDAWISTFAPVKKIRIGRAAIGILDNLCRFSTRDVQSMVRLYAIVAKQEGRESTLNIFFNVAIRKNYAFKLREIWLGITRFTASGQSL